MDHIKGFLSYINKATTATTSVSVNVDKLSANGFMELKMGHNWMVGPSGKYFVRPYPGTLFAFTTGSTNFVQEGFRIITSHTDSPSYRVKAQPEIVSKGYLKLNVDIYGGPIYASWLDRPLSMAGSVILKSDELLKPIVVEIDFEEPILTIPSLAIHFNREVNEGVKIKPEKEMQPLMQMVEDGFESKGYLQGVIANKIGCKPADILDFDLLLYVKEEGAVIGLNKEFISAPRIDNQAMVYASIEAILKSSHQDGVNLVACFDNEEVGSTTKQGANSTLLVQIIERIGTALKKTPQQLYRLFDGSFMISADGAHALHPNYMETSDTTNDVYVNGGLTIKYSAKCAYATDGSSSGAMQQLCEKAGVQVQKMFNKTGIKGGATLGPITNQYLQVPTVDVGMPLLGMHSARELAGTSDLIDTITVFETFFTV